MGHDDGSKKGRSASKKFADGSKKEVQNHNVTFG